MQLSLLTDPNHIWGVKCEKNDLATAIVWIDIRITHTRGWILHLCKSQTIFINTIAIALEWCTSVTRFPVVFRSFKILLGIPKTIAKISIFKSERIVVVRYERYPLRGQYLWDDEDSWRDVARRKRQATFVTRTSMYDCPRWFSESRESGFYERAGLRVAGVFWSSENSSGRICIPRVTWLWKVR